MMKFYYVIYVSSIRSIFDFKLLLLFISGIYMFALNILNNVGYVMRAHIVIATNDWLDVYCDPGEYSACSTTVFSTCHKGEIVYVRSGVDANQRMWGGDQTQRYSSFTGFLMSVA